jgi:hypothetical protein
MYVSSLHYVNHFLFLVLSACIRFTVHEETGKTTSQCISSGSFKLDLLDIAFIGDGPARPPELNDVVFGGSEQVPRVAW